MTTRGKLLFTLIFLGLVGYGIKQWWPKLKPGVTSLSSQAGDQSGAPEIKLADTQFEVPKLAPPAPYSPKDNTLDIELSEYAGYSGLIAANGGLEPNSDSIFAKKHGFKVRIKLSEEESWSALNSGKMAASATTVDVLATYGKQFQVVVPAQIGFSRGADGVVVRSDIRRINDLKGRTLVAPQFTEGDFLIRYLAQEAGLGINMLADLKAKPDPDKLNLVFTEEGPAAGDVFAADLQGGGNRLAGCVTWAPKTNEVAEGSGGKARVLITNTNLLIIADILIVNKGFAQAQPKMVAGLVDGLIEGNRMVRENPDAQLDTIGKAFKWDRAKTKTELAKVHLANGPENLAFISGAIDAAGSFSGIYQSAILAYGDIIKNPLDAERFIDAQHLKALDAANAFAGQQIAIQPIKSGAGGPVEGDPLLSKNIRFTFEPNSSKLDVTNQENIKSLAGLRRLLEISPGSRILLRGHVDNSKVEEFRKQGGESYLREMALRAMQLSKDRASEIAKQLVEREKVDAGRLDTVGRGWEEPLGKNMDENRRVEAQWMTLE